MTNPKLYRTLSRIAPREWLQAEQFLASPYFNRQSDLLQLFRFLKPFYPEFRQAPEAELYAAVWPGQAPDRKFLNGRFSALGRLIDDFFYYRRCAAGDLRLRLAADRERGQTSSFVRSCEREIAQRQAQPLLDAESCGQLKFCYQQLYEHPERSGRESGREEVDRLLHYLDFEYVLVKLRYACDLYARSLTYEEQPRLALWEAVLEHAEALAPDHPLVELYLRLSRLFMEKRTPEAYLQVEALFYRLAPDLGGEDQRFVLIKLCSVCNYLLNYVDRSFAQKLFELFRFGLERDLLMEGPLFPDTTFLNICIVGAHCGAYDWTNRFIERYEKLLPPRLAGAAAGLGRATLLFRQGHYEQARLVLQDIRNPHIAYQIRIRSLLVRALLGEHLQHPQYLATIRATVEAFIRFLYREPDLSAERKAGYRHFARSVLRMAELRSDGWSDPAARADLIQWIRSRQPLMLGDWLLAQFPPVP